MSAQSIQKVLISGPVGSGKTTAISNVSDIPPVSTEEVPTDNVRHIKNNTTVAMDYGVVQLDELHKIHLYGTPGQERFDFMWEILSEGCSGLILLLDCTRPNVFSDLDIFLKAFSDLVDKKSVVIGITHMDLKPDSGMTQYRDYLDELRITAPVFEVDARSPRDIKSLLRALLVHKYVL